VGTILVLEDELSVLRLMALWLKEYKLLQAATAAQALRLFIDAHRRIAVLVTDVRLAKSSGIQVALLLRSQIPDLPVCLISGYPETEWRDSDADDLDRLGSSSVLILQKPITAKALTNAVQELLAAPHPEKARTAAG
jgi:CheY-like chemotaxis protein